MDQNNQPQDQATSTQNDSKNPAPEYTQTEVPPAATPETVEQPTFPQSEQPFAQNTAPVTAPTPVQQTPAHNPGETLGIISIIMTIPLGLSLVGLILGILSQRRSKEAGASTTLGTVGIILGAIGTALVTLGIIAFIALIAIGASQSSINSDDSFEYESGRSSSTL